MKKSNNLLQDFMSGVFVALIALPLSMGIATASGFSPVAGLMTAIIGGLIPGFFGGSRYAIKGPAAGLIVIVLAAVSEFAAVLPSEQVIPMVLAVTVVSGAIQVGLGVAKLANLAKLIPISVLHGMMAAIGVIIMGKQIHVMMGVTAVSKNPLALYAEIPFSLMKANPLLLLIGGGSLLMMFMLPKVKYLNKMPPAILIVGLAVMVSSLLAIDSGYAYSFFGGNYEVTSASLIKISDSLLSEIHSPIWTGLGTFLFWKHVILFALVGSIESVLTGVGLDAMTGTKTDLNKDLTAAGVANVIAGMIGGIPMISGIVRSKANLHAGAQSKWSNFFHGLVMLVALLVFTPLLRQIPLAALAGILVYVGTRLASPHEFKVMKALGNDQLCFFIVTLFLTVAVDLLVGVSVGLIGYALYATIKTQRFSSLWALDYDVEAETATVKVRSGAVFTNSAKIEQAISMLPASQITLDMQDVRYIDHDFLSVVDNLKSEKEIDIIGLDGTKAMSSHALSSRTRE